MAEPAATAQRGQPSVFGQFIRIRSAILARPAWLIFYRWAKRGSFMPSEKLKYLERLPQREAVFSRSWSDEEGGRSLVVSRDGERLFVRIKKEWEGVLEVEILQEDAEEMIRAIEKVCRP